LGQTKKRLNKKSLPYDGGELFAAVLAAARGERIDATGRLRNATTRLWLFYAWS
jgi:hypothetical protein